MEKPEEVGELGEDCPSCSKLVCMEEALMREVERTGEVSRIAAELERRVNELEAQLRDKDGCREWVTDGSKPVWEWKKRFIVYYDAKQLCPYVLCYEGAVHAMFDDLSDAKEYVWEVFD